MTMNVDQLCKIVGYRLSDEQLAAVTADLDQPLRVVAGAGSGKTSVMAARVVWAVGLGHVQASEIVGLTFTNKAAAELAGRVRQLLARLDDLGGAGGQPADGDEGSGESLVTTYHSFAHQLVAEHGLRIGVEPGARLLANNETAQLAFRVLKNTKLPLSGMTGGPAVLVEPVIGLDQQLAEHVVSTDALREHDEDLIERIDSLPKQVAIDRTTSATARRRIQLANVVDELRAAKSQADVVDFADLLRFGVRVAALGEVAKIARERWRLVLLDEYQDTSVVQSELLAGLFGRGHPVTAVGDPLQGIYGWRGASAEAMDAFVTTFSRTDGEPARTAALSISHRSGARILDVANRVAGPLRDGHPTVVTLTPAIAETGYPRADGIVTALFETYQEEVDWVADRVAEQIEAGTAPDDIAVLCRAAADFAPIADALSEAGVPSQVSALEGLLAQPEVIDIVSTLEVLHDPAANPAALRLLLGPRWRIGKRDLAILGRRSADLARAHGTRSRPDPDTARTLDAELTAALAGIDPVDVGSLLEAVEDPGRPADYGYSAAAYSRFAELTGELDAMRLAAGQPLVDLVAQVISTIGLDVEVGVAARRSADLHGGSDYDRGFAVLASFSALVATFADIDGESSLGAFLAWIKAVDRFGGSPEVDIPPAAGAVRILTVHKAKGLEWEVVFVPFMANQVFPTARARSRWTTAQGEIPHTLRGDRDAIPDLAGFGTKSHDLFAEQMKEHSEQEERRLAYVALTRAARLLVTSAHWWGPTQKTIRGPSDYLEAVHESCLEFGTIDCWEPMPEVDSNPILNGVLEFSWPEPIDREQAALRREAAAMVNEHLRGIDPGQVARPDSTDGATQAELALFEQWDDDLAVLLDELATASDVGEVQVPDSLSASDFLSVATDPASYASGLVRPMPRRPSQAADRGTRFHAWVQQRFGQRPLFEELPGASDDEMFSDAELTQIQDAFLQTEFAAKVPYAVEVPFSLVLGGRVVRGRIDAIYRQGDRWQVIDWKTNLGATSDPLQLAIYRAAWARMQQIDPTDIDCAFVYVRRSEVVWYQDLPDVSELTIMLTGY